ncbi:MAG: hypothetical protein ACTHOH_11545 [Lysobacteraceae bacterium]
MASAFVIMPAAAGATAGTPASAANPDRDGRRLQVSPEHLCKPVAAFRRIDR